MADNRECRALPAGIAQAPELPYLPRDPARYRPGIGLIGCGGISPYHLRAYQRAGYRVLALCDIDLERAKTRRAEHFPDADVYGDYRDVLRRDDIEVIDAATHPAERIAIIRDAIRAGKHVLSQKPFAHDIDIGRSLVEEAELKGRKLAVNQNGRWAPHFSYMRQAIQTGLIGDVTGVHLAVHWDHNWTVDTPFNELRHLILYDFAIHWFDILTCFMGDRAPLRVYASCAFSPGQRANPPLLAQALIEYEGAQATLAFDADTRYGPRDQSSIIGTRGAICSSGPDLNSQTVTLYTEAGEASPKLEGAWFTNGFHGTMAELLCAIEEGRDPFNSARRNLRSLELCFAAIASAESHRPVVPGAVRTLPD